MYASPAKFQIFFVFISILIPFGSKFSLCFVCLIRLYVVHIFNC